MADKTYYSFWEQPSPLEDHFDPMDLARCCMDIIVMRALCTERQGTVVAIHGHVATRNAMSTAHKAKQKFLRTVDYVPESELGLYDPRLVGLAAAKRQRIAGEDDRDRGDGWESDTSQHDQVKPLDATAGDSKDGDSTKELEAALAEAIAKAERAEAAAKHDPRRGMQPQLVRAASPSVGYVAPVHTTRAQFAAWHWHPAYSPSSTRYTPSPTFSPTAKPVARSVANRTPTPYPPEPEEVVDLTTD